LHKRETIILLFAQVISPKLATAKHGAGNRRHGKLNTDLHNGVNMSGTIGAIWGIAGVLLLLGSAVWRLTPLAVASFTVPFAWYHWLAWVMSVLLMAHAEGYRGFQMHFSPRVTARAKYLREHPRPVHVVFAPLFCMGYFHATRRRQIVSISLTAGIIVLIIIVHHLPQPWRGIIDTGVVTGLAWGIVSLIWFAARAFAGHGFDRSPEVPESSLRTRSRNSSERK
jgi:hypothetical protein